MIKTLSIHLKDINLDDQMTISGTLNPTEFNKTVVIKIGQTAFPVDSQTLAQALSEIVQFQTLKVEENGK